MRVQTHNTTGTNQLPKPRGWRLESERIERRRFLQVLGLTATALGTAACAPMAGSLSDSGVDPSLPADSAAPNNALASARLAGPGTTAAPAVPTVVTATYLQLLLDSATDVCIFPGGVIDLPEGTTLRINKSMRIEGNGTTLRVAGSKPPTAHLLNADSLRDGSQLEIKNLRIEGPSTANWEPATENIMAAISWQLYRTWNSRFMVRNVTITGGYGSGIIRAGGGAFEVTDCDLSGWVDGIAFFESHGGSGSLELRNTTLRAPANSKYSSIGLYIHPHLNLNADKVTGLDWNRYVIYLNGTPVSTGTHNLTNVSAINCALVQTGSSSQTTLMRCSESGQPKNGGSFLKGSVTSIDSTWEGGGMIALLEGVNVDRRFINDTIRPKSIWMALGSKTAGTVSITGAQVDLAGKAALVKLTSTSTTAVTITSSQIRSTSSSFPINAEGGSVQLLNTVAPQNSRAVLPGRLIL
ncbi:MAG: hypothetical protein WCJ04_03185 [Actinomycetes bacterium]